VAKPIALREQTASRLLRRLNEIPGGAGGRGAGAGGYSVVLVRCTDDEPAAGSGVGAECYPGVVVRTAASLEVAEQEDAGAVWLTVLSGDAAAEPAFGGLYWCQLSGPVEIGGVTRPRAFGTGPGALSHGSAGGAEFNLAHETWTAVDSVTVPSAGTYLLWGSVSANCEIQAAHASLADAGVNARLVNVGTGFLVPNTNRAVCGTFGMVSLTGPTGGVWQHAVRGSAFMQAVVEVAAETEFAVEAWGTNQPSSLFTSVAWGVVGYARLAGAGPSGGGGLTGTFGG